MDGEISPGELESLLAEDTTLRIVDVRREPAFREGHIPGSECLPLPSLPSRIETLDGAERVVTVCPHGDASVKAARLIAAYEGIDEDTRVESLEGGLAAWDGTLEAGDSADPGENAGHDAPL